MVLLAGRIYCHVHAAHIIGCEGGCIDFQIPWLGRPLIRSSYDMIRRHAGFLVTANQALSLVMNVSIWVYCFPDLSRCRVVPEIMICRKIVGVTR